MVTSIASGRVLVIDEDVATLNSLTGALSARGHRVTQATDGREGLSRAVEMSAEVIVVALDTPVLDIRAFLDVIRDNPRTSDAQTFVLGDGDPSHNVALPGNVEHIVKPFNAEEVAARIDEVVRIRRTPRREPELKGDLSQVALFDLLQVFAANRRTGKLLVQSPTSIGEVWLHEGEIVDATHGLVVGDKALYRVLAIRSGQFMFLPDVEYTRRRVHGSIDQLLMEAVRRIDEVERALEDVPSLEAMICLSSSISEPKGIAEELVANLDHPKAVDELLDLIPAHDLEIVQEIARLLQAGHLSVVDEGGRVRFCTDSEAPAIRAATLRLRRAGADGPVRLGLLSADAGRMEQFVHRLRGIREFVPAFEPPVPTGSGAFGAIGTIRLGGTELELFALPVDPSLRPWWGAFLASTTAVLVVGAQETDEDITRLTSAIDVKAVCAPGAFERSEQVVAAVREVLPLARA